MQIMMRGIIGTEIPPLQRIRQSFCLSQTLNSIVLFWCRFKVD